MYTLEELRDKTFKELKEIGWQLNVLPAGDRRCRQNWIDAISGTRLPLLELLEISPSVEVEPVVEAIKVQAQKPFQVGDLVEPLYDRWGIDHKILTGTVILVHRSGSEEIFGIKGSTMNKQLEHFIDGEKAKLAECLRGSGRLDEDSPDMPALSDADQLCEQFYDSIGQPVNLLLYPRPKDGIDWEVLAKELKVFGNEIIDKWRDRKKAQDKREAYKMGRE